MIFFFTVNAPLTVLSQIMRQIGMVSSFSLFGFLSLLSLSSYSQSLAIYLPLAPFRDSSGAGTYWTVIYTSPAIVGNL